MSRIFVGLIIALATVALSQAQDAPRDSCSRQEKWQEYLEGRKFSFSKHERGLIASMDNFSANCQLHIVLTPNPDKRMFFKFVLKDKEILTLPGHYESIFRTADEKLYFAHFDPLDSKCTVVAYDLIKGEKLWETGDISQLKQGGASAYTNQVLLRLSMLNEVPNEPKGAAIIITGNENFGHYIAILDRATGNLLGHKIYGTRFWGRTRFGESSTAEGGARLGSP